MMFQNKKTFSIFKAILIIWLVFTTLYFIWGEYNRLNQFVYNKGLTTGYGQAVTDLIKQSQACKPVPVFVENQTEELINLKCLNKTEAPSPSSEVNANKTK